MAANLHRGKPAILVSRGHAHGGVHGRRWRSRTVGAASRARVVLGAAPAEAHARVADGVALHLVDGHLGSVALDELDETTAFAGRNLDVGDFTESLEERAQLILGDVAGQTTNEDSGVVGVGELVHGLGSAVEAHGRAAHRGVHAGRAGHAHVGSTDAGTLVLGGSGRDTHGAVAAVDPLHLGEGTLLVVLIGEADKTVSTGHAADGIGHDLGGLARGETALEERHKDVFVDLGAEITNEDGVLRTTIITAEMCVSTMLPWVGGDVCSPAVGQTAAGSPVQLEDPVGVGHGSAVQREGFGSGGRGREIHKAVSSIAPTTNIRTSISMWKIGTDGLTQRTCPGSS